MKPGPTRTGARGIGDRWRLVIAALVWLLVAACTDSASGDRPVQATSQPTSAVARTYWPTVGWRTAAPEDHGMDAKALAQIEDLVAKGYTTVRSVLVVRDGYLVYERYWQGLDKNSGHDVRSVTKSVVGALVGVALAEGKIESLEQTVGELVPDRFPPDADPRFARVTVQQLLTMTSGLGGDEPSLSGDASLEDALLKSPDWVRHILAGGWIPIQVPASPTATPRRICCRPSWPPLPGSPRWRSPAPGCSVRSVSAPRARLSRC